MRRALVTGSSRGIGRAIALRLAKDGFGVTLHCRAGIDEAKKVAAEIGKAPILQFDVRDRAAAKAALEADVAANGAYYGVVVNAGVARDNTFAALSDEDWDEVLDTSLGGFYNVMRPLVMPMVRAKAGGRIVVLSSVSGVMGNRGQVNYSAAKAGLAGAAKALAVELATRNITVNCVAPGPVATDMIAAAPLEEMLKAVPMRRVGTPEEVAATVAFLFSDAAGYITRQVIGVNGGMV
ncbi:MAG: 3-oxoacyl-[acyl-carrier protein] reductase [Betaproteobacteria bacterium]|jgi:3-oxoacyl-[acyl-carrier protein] reductase|nr:3-oxoacyl-[acyl-carrier protein] reductase [Betaproteobacteria bacterium]